MRWEKEKWKGDAGDQLRVFDTPYGRIAILICYDIEFPELSRKVCEMGADIIFVPSCTDDRQGFLRVRYCCHARAIENQVFVAVTGTVGNLPVEGLGLHYGPVVAGDIGSRRSMAFATVGDTTNVTSRLQALTRELGTSLVASGALVAAVEREAADVTLLKGLTAHGAHVLRGRDAPIDLWAE